MPDPMNALTESVGIRLDRTERAIAQNTEAIGHLTTRIDGLTAATERLERSVTNLVAGINAQKETMALAMTQQGEFLKLCTRQADIIENLTRGQVA